MLFLIWKFGYNKCHIANQVFLFQDIHPPTVEPALACLSTSPVMKIYKNNLQTENLQHVNQTLSVILTLSFPLDASLFKRTCFTTGHFLIAEEGKPLNDFPRIANH